MAIRFRKRIRLLPGIHLNLGKSGVSLSGGVPGASITAGKQGLYKNFGFPGTGLSVRSKLGSGGSNSQPVVLSKESEQASFAVVLRLHENGEVAIEDENGEALTQRQLKSLRDQRGDFIRLWLEQSVAKLNFDYEASVNLHCETPSPTSPRWLTLPSFDEPTPEVPQPKTVRLIDRLLLRRRQIDLENAKRLEEYERELERWNTRANEHLQLIDGWRSLAQGVVNGEKAAMEAVIGNVLSTLPWPRETDVSFEFSDDCATLDLDVDLPEIEDMPDRIAKVSARGIRVHFQKRTDAQIRRDYARLVHGTAFRIAGEAFASLPTVAQVAVSQFTQRPNPQTGDVVDDYVLSVRIRRSEWESINFTKLQDVDPAEALARFELVRSYDRAGRLREIVPLK